MTKREFVKLKKGDILIAIRHILDDDGQIAISENSEWKVHSFDTLPQSKTSDKPEVSIEIINIADGNKHQITKETSTNFLVYKRKRGPLPKEESSS
jgi:hypothetical protein